MPGVMNKPPSSPRPSARRPARRVLLPLCALVLIVAPGCVAANPFFRVTATLWSAWLGTP